MARISHLCSRPEHGPNRGSRFLPPPLEWPVQILMANGTEENEMYGLVEHHALRQRVEEIRREVATCRLRHGEHRDRGASGMIEAAVTGGRATKRRG